MRDRMDIQKELIPTRATVPIEMQVFDFEFNYNAEGDFFTVSLYQDGRLICAGEPLIYGRPLFKDGYRPGNYPLVPLVPLDEAGEETHVGWQALGNRVFLTLDTTEGGADEQLFN